MKKRGMGRDVLIIGVSLLGMLGLNAALADDQADIKALEQRYVTAARLRLWMKMKLTVGRLMMRANVRYQESMGCVSSPAARYERIQRPEEV
jgi:hypothetical protein